MSKLPLCPSREVIKALLHAGFEPAREATGSHQVFERKQGGRTWSTPVPLNKKEIPTGTLRSIIKLGGMTEEEFLWHLRNC